MVWDRRPSYNNETSVTNNSMTTCIKLVYYVLFACLYSMAGSLCSLVMVNSSWTRNHITSLWWWIVGGAGRRSRIHTVFPPCDTESLKDLSLVRNDPIIVSIGQFRPEKDHILQIRAFAMLRTTYPKWTAAAKLVLIGSCRGGEDESRVRALRDLVSSLGLGDSVEFVLNQPDSVKKEWFAKASVGLHTMWNEHFGIGVVEMMAAGLLVVAHNSGGPRQDIVISCDGKRTGFLATSVEEFGNAMNEALSLDATESRNTRDLARLSTCRFSDEKFNATFKTVMLQSGLLS